MGVRWVSDTFAPMCAGARNRLTPLRLATATCDWSYCGMLRRSSQRYSDRRLIPSCFAAAALLPLTWRSTRVI